MAQNQSEVVRPVISTSAEKPEAAERTFVNNMPEALSVLDAELHRGYLLQTAYQNETDYRLFGLVQATVNYNKATARANVADYERSVDAFAKLPQYKKTHTRDAAEAIFVTTEIGKIKLAIKKVSAQYLEEHK